MREMEEMKREKIFDDIITSLSLFKGVMKYKTIEPFIFLHSKSIYLVGEQLSAKVEFNDISFDELVSIPIGQTFESSETISDSSVSMKISRINEISRRYCDTLFYINKSELMSFIDERYNSLAKLNKMMATIATQSGPSIDFKPIKKSTSVFESEYVFDTTNRVYNNFRLGEDSVTISALLLQEALKNTLCMDTLKFEISKQNFARISCTSDKVSVKFIISGEH